MHLPGMLLKESEGLPVQLLCAIKMAKEQGKKLTTKGLLQKRRDTIRAIEHLTAGHTHEKLLSKVKEDLQYIENDLVTPDVHGIMRHQVLEEIIEQLRMLGESPRFTKIFEHVESHADCFVTSKIMDADDEKRILFDLFEILADATAKSIRQSHIRIHMAEREIESLDIHKIMNGIRDHFIVELHLALQANKSNRKTDGRGGGT